MKPLNEYPTPETDAFYSGPCNLPLSRRQRQFARLMEQRLSACRDALTLSLEVIEATGPGSYPEAETQIRETLDATK